MLFLRNQLGLTQVELAELLNVGRTTFRMYEQRGRTLPGQALLKLSLMQIKIDGGLLARAEHLQPHALEEPLNEECQKAADAMWKREDKCRKAIKKLSANLTGMKLLYQQTRRWLHLVETSLQEKSFTIPLEEMWWQVQQVNALEKLDKCSLHRQLLLQNKLDLLSAEAEINRSLRKEFVTTVNEKGGVCD